MRCRHQVFFRQRFVRVYAEGFWGWFKEKVNALWKRIRRNILEYGMLLVVVLFGVCYFGYGMFQDSTYGFSDMYVHHSWTYQLTEGNVFSAGVYPMAMHCLIYSLHVLFGIEIFVCNLFLATVNVMVFLVSIYLFLREIFCWKYSREKLPWTAP